MNGEQRRNAARWALAAVVAGALAACSAPAPAPGNAPGNGAGSGPATSGTGGSSSSPAVVASKLEAPWSVALVGSTALISLRDSGQILELLSDGSTRVVGTVPGVKHGGEGGLLGLAVDAESRLYVVSTGNTENRVQRFELRGKPGAYSLGEAHTVIGGLPAGNNHNGGRLGIGPDRKLYVTAGDAGDRALAQDKESLAGKILRLELDGSVPADNPFPGSPVYSWGHRNPQGLAWGSDGTMYASEFGQDTWDEINVIVAGKNYGWPVVEGKASREGFQDPWAQFAPEDASPSGIAVLGNTLYMANLRGRSLMALPLAGGGAHSVVLEGKGRLRDVVPAPGGGLWVLSNNTDGRGQPAEDDDVLLALTPPGAGGTTPASTP